jgi:hypothetical protein
MKKVAVDVLAFDGIHVSTLQVYNRTTSESGGPSGAS